MCRCRNWEEAAPLLAFHLSLCHTWKFYRELLYNYTPLTSLFTTVPANYWWFPMLFMYYFYRRQSRETPSNWTSRDVLWPFGCASDEWSRQRANDPRPLPLGMDWQARIGELCSRVESHGERERSWLASVRGALWYRSRSDTARKARVLEIESASSARPLRKIYLCFLPRYGTFYARVSVVSWT